MTIVDEGVESKPYSNIADGKGMINYYAKNAYKSISKTLDELMTQMWLGNQKFLSL